MFLGDLEIRQCLATGRLGIDPPPDESQLSAFAIELRLGTQFLKLPIGDQAMDALDPGRPWHMVPDRQSLYAIELGDRVTISSGEVIMGTTLEYVHLPVDLAGFLFPKHALERVGLSLSTGTVDPGFQGRLAFAIRSMGRMPIVLHPGQRIIRLCFARIGRSSAHYESPAQPYVASRALPGAISEDAEIRTLKEALERDVPAPAAKATPPAMLSERLAAAEAEKDAKKGGMLEQVVEDIFSSLEGLRIVKAECPSACGRT